MKLFKVKGEFREGHIGFSGEAPFFSCIAIATEEKLAEANEIKMPACGRQVTRSFSI